LYNEKLQQISLDGNTKYHQTLIEPKIKERKTKQKREKKKEIASH
jgi:hypothetical protein